MSDVTDKQAAFLMRHLSADDRERMIADANNAIDARHWFAERDQAAFKARLSQQTKGDMT